MEFINKNRSLIYTVLVALLFATYPLSLYANSIAMELIILFYFLDYKKNIKQKLNKAFKNRFVWLSILYCVVQFFGLLYSDDIGLGLKQANHAIPFLILPIIALSEKVSKKHLLILQDFIKYWTVAIMLFFICYHLFVVKSTMNTFVDFTVNEISSTSQLYPSALVIIAIMITINQIVKNQKRILNILIAFFCLYCLLLLSSRIAVLTLIIATSYMLLAETKRVSVINRVLLLIGALIMFSISIYNVPRIKQKVDVFYKTTDFDMDVILTKNSITRTKNTVEHRFLVYYTASKAIIKALPFGYGTGDYQTALNNGYNKIEFKIGKEKKFDTHNQFLEEFLKTGIPGGFIFLALMIALLKFSRNNNYLIVSMIIFSLMGCLFDSFLARQHGVLFTAFFIPFFFYNNELNNKKVLI